MKIIKTLSDKIHEEICDAKAYAKLAIEYKDERPDLARSFYNLSLQEMDHMNVLHNAVTDIINRCTDYCQILIQTGNGSRSALVLF